jgi:phenylpropionate dioxygenase-like ring-hydroxylating dioxygenase large terminal subunit
MLLAACCDQSVYLPEESTRHVDKKQNALENERVARWLLNCWQVAAFSHELTQQPLARRINNFALVLFRAAGGEAGALEDRCPHRFAPLSLGKVVGEHLQCGYHGIQFDTAGLCVAIPGQTGIPAHARARSFPLVEEYGLVWIWMGTPELAGHTAVPDIFWLASDEWTCCAGYTYVRADYRLLNDNLLDLTHETFVHDAIIGNRAVADSPAEMKVLDDDRVEVFRYMADCEPPPLYVTANKFTGHIDRWHKTIYRPPGYLLIENGAKPTGSENPADVTERRIINLVTPETATSTHYFWAIARNYLRDDVELTEHLQERTSATFAQDVTILEGQQRSIDAHGSDDFRLNIRVDAGPIQGRRLLERRIAAQ